MELLITIIVAVGLWSMAGVACFCVTVCIFKRQWDRWPAMVRGALGIVWGPGCWALALIGNMINARRFKARIDDLKAVENAIDAEAGRPAKPINADAALQITRLRYAPALHRMLERIVTEADTGNSELRGPTYGDAVQLLREIEEAAARQITVPTA